MKLITPIMIMSFNDFLMLFTFNHNVNPMTSILLFISIASLLFMIGLHFLHVKRSSCKVFLVDFACYKPPPTQMCPHEVTMAGMRKCKVFTKETLDFTETVLGKSGLGNSTYAPEVFLRDPLSACMEDSRKEVEDVMFGAIDKLLGKTGINREEIGIVVTTSCVFNPVPCFSSMIVNRYKLGGDVITYNLTGMGCSAGLIAIGLVKNLLQVHRDSYALVVSTESLSQNPYFGNDRSKILANCIFRVGGSAILLSNRTSDKRLAKYQLLHTVHTNIASSDLSHNSLVREEDSYGTVGMTVTKDLLVSATKAIEINLTSLGHLILPLSEKLRFLKSRIARKTLGLIMSIKPYVPRFNKTVNHFLSHVGGKPVLDKLQKNLGFSDGQMEPSRMMLYRFGNLSSSSIWYSLAYAEAKGQIKKGDVAWQLSFGSGFKCSSVVWRAMKNVGYDETNPWSEEIHEFPVEWTWIAPESNNNIYKFSSSK